MLILRLTEKEIYHELRCTERLKEERQKLKTGHHLFLNNTVLIAVYVVQHLDKLSDGQHGRPGLQQFSAWPRSYFHLSLPINQVQNSLGRGFRPPSVRAQSN